MTILIWFTLSDLQTHQPIFTVQQKLSVDVPIHCQILLCPIQELYLIEEFLSYPSTDDKQVFIPSIIHWSESTGSGHVIV